MDGGKLGETPERSWMGEGLCRRAGGRYGVAVRLVIKRNPKGPLHFLRTRAKVVSERNHDKTAAYGVVH